MTSARVIIEAFLEYWMTTEPVARETAWPNITYEEYDTDFTSIPIAWENVGYEGSDYFLAPAILTVSSERQVMGDSIPYENRYILHINIFSRTDIGTKESGYAYDKLRTLLNEQVIDGLVFRVVQEGTGRNDGNGYWQVPLRVEFSEYL